MTMPDPPSGLVSRLHAMLSAAFSENDGDIGTQMLGDWLVLAEVQSMEGPVMRIVTADDTPLWRQQGLLKFAIEDLTNDVLIYRLSREGDDC